MTPLSEMKWPRRYNEVPKEIFVRDDVYQYELEKVFYGPLWHPIGHVSEIPNSGDFKTIRLAEIPLLVVRGKDDEVRVFYNSCSHRGTQVETASHGNRKQLMCPYHRWTFNTEGELTGCPSQSDFQPGFDRKDYPLPSPRMEIFKGLIFVTLSPETESLDEFLGETKETLAESMGGDGRLRLLGYQKVRYQANWKTYADNDGYHPPLLHAAFRMLNWQGGVGKVFATDRGHVVTFADLVEVQDNGFLSDPSLIQYRSSAGERLGTRCAGLFPTFISIQHLGNFNLRFVIPLGVDETEVHYTYFAHEDDDEATVEHRIRQCSNLLGPSGMISLEDAAIFNRAHIGNHTPGLAIIQKGVKDPMKLSSEFTQNDETTNEIFWERYIELLEIERVSA